MDEPELVWDLEDDPDGNVWHIGENDLTVDEVEDVLLYSHNKMESSRSSGFPITFRMDLHRTSYCCDLEHRQQRPQDDPRGDRL